MSGDYQKAWDELVMKCQYDTGGMNITEFQKSLIVWADSWVRAAQPALALDVCQSCGSTELIPLPEDERYLVCADCGTRK